MKRQDVLSILFTFVIGVFAGGYLYVAHFATVYSPDRVPTETDVEELIIIGEAYGGCRTYCSSFQVLADGSYRYQFYSDSTAPKVLKEGTLPLTLRRSLSGVLTTTALLTQSQEVEPENCNSYTDGIDIRYNITVEGALYYLDSCGTAIDDGGALWESLSDVWSYFQTVE